MLKLIALAASAIATLSQPAYSFASMQSARAADAVTEFCNDLRAEADEDRFTGQTVLHTTFHPKAFEFQPTLRWTTEAPDRYQFEVIGSAESWRYLTCQTMAILADGERVSLSHVAHEGTVRAGFVIETLDGLIDRETAQKLSLVNKFEYKVCNDEAVASLEFTCQVRDIVKRSLEWKKGQPVPGAAPPTEQAGAARTGVREEAGSGPKDQATASVESAAAVERRAVAQRTRGIYLSKGFDVKVGVSGTEATTMTLEFPAINNEWVHIFMRQDEALAVFRRKGFEYIVFSDGGKYELHLKL